MIEERGKHEFAANVNEFMLTVFAVRNRVLRKREFAVDHIPIFFVFYRDVCIEVSCAMDVRYILHVYVYVQLFSNFLS